MKLNFHVLKRILVFMTVGTILCTPLDALQVVGGVRTLGSNSWATPLEFAIVGGLLGLITFWLDPTPKSATKWSVTIDIAIFAAIYLMTLLDGVGASLEVLTFISGVMLIQIIRSFLYIREIFPLLLLLTIIGPVIEILLVHLGTFKYTHGSFYGVPMWLPLLWGSAAFFVRSLAGEMKNKKDDREKNKQSNDSGCSHCR